MEITIEEIQKKFDNLPEDLRWAIMAADVDEKITEIGKSQNLTVQQMGQLSLETHVVMFGLIHPDKFEESLQASLGLEPEKIKTIVMLVNEKILKNIREKIMSLYKNKDHQNIPIEEDHSSHISSLEEAMGSKNTIPTPTSTFDIKKEGVEKNIPISTVSNPVSRVTLDTTASISEQKLFNSYQAPKTTTEYEADSIQKDAIDKTKTGYLNKIDPYRMPIE